MKLDLSCIDLYIFESNSLNCHILKMMSDESMSWLDAIIDDGKYSWYPKVMRILLCGGES